MISSGVDVIEFTWRIENCDFFMNKTFRPQSSDDSDQQSCRIPHRMLKNIRSPLISAGNPVHSVWCLDVYALVLQAGDHLLRYSVFRLNGSFEGQYTCKVSLVGLNGTIPNVPLSDTNGLCVDEQYFSEGVLTLRCRLTFTDVPQQHAVDLKELQQRTCSLFGSVEFSDLTLYTRNKEIFVHKFLLHERAPKLFEDLGLLYENDTKERVKVGEISTPVLQTLLQYIYSGKWDSLPEENLSELYEAIEKYQVEEFCNVIRLKKSATIISKIKVIRKFICLKIEACEAPSDTDILFEQINLEYARFLVKISLSVNDLEICLHAMIRCLSALDDDILMNCTISSGIDENDLENEDKNILIFSTRNDEKEYILPLQLNYNYEDIQSQDMHLRLNLSVSKGQHFHSVDGMTPTKSNHLPSIFGLGVLSYDVNKLGGQTFYFKDCGDVNICFEHKALSAHKAVLAAWSPVFACMFHHDMAEKNSGTVNVSDIDFKTGLRLLRFMYSGLVTKGSYEADVRLYSAADKYQVSSLFIKCACFLGSHLITDNACDMLVLADRHSDENLLATVQKCIVTKPYDILGSIEWLSLIETHPRLVSRILQEITVELRPWTLSDGRFQ